MFKIIVVPSTEKDKDSYIQLFMWSKPQGGPWCAIRDKNGAIIGWRHYFKTQKSCEESTGFYPPPAASISKDGGCTWSPLSSVDEKQWIGLLKNDLNRKWWIRRELKGLVARVVD